MSEVVFRTVILANGQFPCSNTALECLRQAEQIICCDGALDKLVAAGFEPSAIVGDLDSAQAADLQRWKDRVHPDKSEEYNDLQKALKYCITEHLNPVTLLGCGGDREDHFIANLSIMATYSEHLDMKMVTDYGTFIAIRQTSTLPSFKGQPVSVFCKDEHLPLTFHNLKYPVHERCFQHLWEGSLNEALDNEFSIELHGEGVVVVYLGNS